MKTEVEWDDRLPRSNVEVHEGLVPYQIAEEIFLTNRLLVIDDIDWGDALGVIQRDGLDARRRYFKDAYIEKTPTPAVAKAVDEILAHTKSMYHRLYSWPSTVQHSSFRPMVTGAEPMHYDSYGGKHPMVTAYINVSAEPRVYRVSWNFEQLVAQDPVGVRAAFAEREQREDDASYPIRMRTQKGRGPLGPDAPRHTVHLAPGAIWFFNAKTVSHEVVYGTGTIGIGWEVPSSGAKLQREILKGIR